MGTARADGARNCVAALAWQTSVQPHHFHQAQRADHSCAASKRWRPLPRGFSSIAVQAGLVCRRLAKSSRVGRAAAMLAKSVQRQILCAAHLNVSQFSDSSTAKARSLPGRVVRTVMTRSERTASQFGNSTNLSFDGPPIDRISAVICQMPASGRSLSGHRLRCVNI